jgi:tetratricopeptide (TPR) repeat protein
MCANCTMRSSKHLQKSLIALPALLFVCFAWSQSLKDRTDRIASELQNEQYEQALVLLRPALSNFPGDAQLWAMQGVALAHEGRKKEALGSFQHALRIFPDYLPALRGAIQIEFDSGNLSAIPLLVRVLRQYPDDQTSHGMLAVLEYQQGDCAAAVPHFEKSGPLFDSRPSALHAYATCLVKLKRFDEAAKTFERTLEIDPDNSQERRLLASVQLMARQPEAAAATIEPLLAANPDTETLELAANAHEDSGETDKAVNELRQAILLDPKNVNLYVDFASICFSHQSFQVGINVVSDGVSQQPKSAQLYFARGVLYVQLADYDKAQADLAKAYELDPNESLTAAAQGLLAVQQNDLNRARADVKEKLKRKPDDPVLLYLQADVLAQQGAEPGTNEFQLALQSAKRAVALRPSLAAARAVLAKLYLQSGKNAEAAEQCRKALQIDPKDQTSVYRLIQALRKSGQAAEVPELLKRLAQLRQDAAREQKQRNRYKLVEADAQP